MILRSLDLDALKATPVTREPFEYFVVPGFVRPEARAKINADYPKISEGGSFPVAQLSYGPAFREFVAELESDEFRHMIMEVPPTEGTLLAFKRADNSWHGHKSFAGERRVIQFNWVTSEGDRRMAMLRHHVSAPLKRLFAAMRPSAA